MSMCKNIDSLITVDIGATNLKTSLLKTNTSNIDDVIEKKTTLTKGNIEKLKEQLHKVLKYYFDNYEEIYNIIGIAIATVGRVDFNSGQIIYGSGNIKNLSGYDIKNSLQNLFDCPVIVDNDCNAAGWGEFVYRSKYMKRNIKNLCVVAIGTGVGAGIIHNGNLIRGVRGRAGEIGHMRIVEHGRKCTCNYYGCLESYVGKIGIMRTAKKYYSDKDLKKMKVKDIYDQYPSNMNAKKTVEKTGYHLAIGLSNLIHVFDPEMIIFGGGVSQAKEKLINSVSQHLFDDKIKKEDLKLEIAKLGNRAGQIGAKEMFLEHMIT